MDNIDIRNDGSQRVRYDYEGYFACVRKYFLSHYHNYTGDSHWHHDLEFIYIFSGEMKFNVNGEIVPLKAGNGIFVNQKQLHFAFSNTRSECEFLCVLLHPMLLCTTQKIEETFVSPILCNTSVPYILLEREIPWQREILTKVSELYSIRNDANALLYIQNSFLGIWLTLYKNIKAASSATPKTDRRLYCLKDMLMFIHKNYSDNITLSDIARSGSISKSTCLGIFKQYLKDTPTNHLIAYRLKKASQLLCHSDMPIAEIALAVGFQSISYFTMIFHKSYGVTPREYRNIHSQK